MFSRLSTYTINVKKNDKNHKKRTKNLFLSLQQLKSYQKKKKWKKNSE